MINTIFDVVNDARRMVLPLGVTVYKFVRPSTSTGECIVIDYMPLKKNNVDSVNDLVFFIYVPKIADEANSKRIETICNAINGYTETFVATKGIIKFNKNLEAYTSNYDATRTVTQLRLKTINS